MLRDWVRWRFWLLGLLVLLWTLGAGLLVFDPRPQPRMAAGDIANGPAAEVQQVLREHFGLRQESVLALVTQQPPPPELLNQLKASAPIKRIQELPATQAHRHRIYALQMDPDVSVYAVEQQVPKLREHLQQWRARTGQTAWLTGQQAFYYDVASAGGKDTRRSESWGLLLAFGVLIFCFGSLTSALIPLLLGVSTLLGTQLAMRWLQLGSSQASTLLNSMVGLGLSIDYALFILSRYREERRLHEPAVAMGLVLRHTGRTIVYSAAVMLGALATLMIPEVDALRGTVINLLLVVALAALNALLVLPVLLLALDQLMDWPRGLSRRVLSWHSEARWRRLAHHVTGLPRRYALLSLALLLFLAYPMTSLRLWEPMQTLAPRDSESVQAVEALAADGWGGEVMPVQVLVYAPPGESLLNTEHLRSLYELIRALESRPEVASVQGLVSSREPLSHYLALYSQLAVLSSVLPAQLPLLRQTPAGEVTLINIHPKQLMNIAEAYVTLDWLKSYAQAHPELRLTIGGPVARSRAITEAIYAPLGLILGLILLIILGLLAFYLRSVVLPIKAGIMNFLPILSAFGIMVWAFQWGGIATRPGITNMVPITLFCIVFGLSMDYEVLILSRIDEAWRITGNVRESVVTGLSQSSGIITGAALILLGVFLPGVFSSSQIVQEISLGISATILLDATLVRLFLVPSFMMLMGHWNWWYPGRPKKAPHLETGD